MPKSLKLEEAKKRKQCTQILVMSSLVDIEDQQGSVGWREDWVCWRLVGDTRPFQVIWGILCVMNV